jgi:SAM-dependent methyltransferase
MKTVGYSEDLAYIHDAGFTEFARHAGQGIFGILRANGMHGGRIIDIGCGTGVLAGELVAAGYRVLGIDISPAMLRIARSRARGARFRAASFLRTRIPACEAIVSVGECLNYMLDPSNAAARLESFFERAFCALRPGGMLLFDMIEPLKTGARAGTACRVGRDWAVVAERDEDSGHNILTRHITSFRLVGRHYRRTDEIHQLKLYRRNQVCEMLRRVGFKVRVRRGYGTDRLAAGHLVYIARRPC